MLASLTNQKSLEPQHELPSLERVIRGSFFTYRTHHSESRPERAYVHMTAAQVFVSLTKEKIYVIQVFQGADSGISRTEMR